MPLTRIRPGDHVFIAGKTGSGKTYLARYLTRPLKRLIAIDTKGELNEAGDPPWALDEWDRKAQSALERGEPVRACVEVGYNETADDVYRDVFDRCYWAGNCVLYIDELQGVIEPGQRASREMYNLWQRGRSRGVSGWAATQSPVWLPLFSIREAKHFFCFRLNMQEDRHRMAAFMGAEVENEINDEWGFWYARDRDRAPTYVSQLIVSDKPIEIENTQPERIKQ